MATTRYLSRLAIPLLTVLSADWAYGNINNLFDLNNITIDPTYTSGVIAPFTADCTLYGLTGCSGPTRTFQEGFPIANLFGGHIQTAEGTYDTIFGTPSRFSNDNGLSFFGYENVFFHLTNLQSVTGLLQLGVTGAQDGPTTFRSFTYFDLISYTLDPADPLNASKYNYTSLYHGTPATAANGFESLFANVNLTNAGPYFVYQFGTADPNTGAGGPRIFSTLTPEPGFYGLLALGLGGLAFVRRPRKNSDSEERFYSRICG
jgi:hypothetical protein